MGDEAPRTAVMEMFLLGSCVVFVVGKVLLESCGVLFVVGRVLLWSLLVVGKALLVLWRTLVVLGKGQWHQTLRNLPAPVLDKRLLLE